MERELVRLQHSHGQLREISRVLGFDVAGLLHTHSSDGLILLEWTVIRCVFQEMCSFDLNSQIY